MKIKINQMTGLWDCHGGFYVGMSREYEDFWRMVHSFPLGLWCGEFEYHNRAMEPLPKDCGRCYHLQFGKCSKGLIPNIEAMSL